MRALDGLQRAMRTSNLFLWNGIDTPWLLRNLEIYTVFIISFTVLALGGFIAAFHLGQMLGTTNGDGEKKIDLSSKPTFLRRQKSQATRARLTRRPFASTVFEGDIINGKRVSELRDITTVVDFDHT